MEQGARHLSTKIARRAEHLNNFFKCPGYARGFARGGCSRLELTHTLLLLLFDWPIREPFEAAAERPVNTAALFFVEHTLTVHTVLLYVVSQNVSTG